MQGGGRFPEVGRRNPSAGVHLSLSGRNIVLLTVTTERRTPWLANATVHEGLRAVWLDATAWLVGDYVLMPDHLHCFCAPRDYRIPIERWMAYWKGRLHRSIGSPVHRFQSRGWHHRLRDDENYSEKWQYMQENPVRRGLVNSTEDWPYRGRMHDIRP